jgi:hypothetical protein
VATEAACTVAGGANTIIRAVFGSKATTLTFLDHLAVAALRVLNVVGEGLRILGPLLPDS